MTDAYRTERKNSLGKIPIFLLPITGMGINA